MPEQDRYELQLGEVANVVTLDDYAVRFISYKTTGGEEDLSSWVMQGHITNAGSGAVGDLQIDVSFFDAQDAFLGLSKTGILDVQDLDARQTIPFSLDLDIPEETTRLVLNVTASKKGFLSRWF